LTPLKLYFVSSNINFKLFFCIYSLRSNIRGQIVLPTMSAEPLCQTVWLKDKRFVISKSSNPSPGLRPPSPLMCLAREGDRRPGRGNAVKNFFNGHAAVDPGRVQAISRWLSGAIPPVSRDPTISTLEGTQPCACDPSRVNRCFCHHFRWYRCAQPPANCCDPSRVFTESGFTKNP
jgi:hypothetical protein